MNDVTSSPVVSVAPSPPPASEEELEAAKDAHRALLVAILGALSCGFLVFWAHAKASKALLELENHPEARAARSEAKAAIWIARTVIVLYVLAVLWAVLVRDLIRGIDQGGREPQSVNTPVAPVPARPLPTQNPNEASIEVSAAYLKDKAPLRSMAGAPLEIANVDSLGKGFLLILHAPSIDASTVDSQEVVAEAKSALTGGFRKLAKDMKATLRRIPPIRIELRDRNGRLLGTFDIEPADIENKGH